MSNLNLTFMFCVKENFESVLEFIIQKILYYMLPGIRRFLIPLRFIRNDNSFLSCREGGEGLPGQTFPSFPFNLKSHVIPSSARNLTLL